MRHQHSLKIKIPRWFNIEYPLIKIRYNYFVIFFFYKVLISSGVKKQKIISELIRKLSLKFF